MAKTQAQRMKEYQVRMAKNNGGNQSYSSKDQQKSTEPVSVPYNFVSLPKQVIPAEFFTLDSSKDNKELYKQHILTNGKNSGYIDIDILTQTPLFIGGNVVTKNGEEYQEFFGGNDNPIIPGSSIKSMIKQILKIVTASGFKAYDSKSGVGDFEDYRLFYREVGSAITDYQSKMIESCRVNGKWTSKTKAKAGFIMKTVDHKFYVVNADFESLKYEKYPHLKDKNGNASIDWEDSYVDIHTGTMANKNSFVRIFKPRDFANGRILISEEVINNYNFDSNRNTINLLEIDNDKVDKNGKSGKSGSVAKGYTGCLDITYVVPCFYKIENGKVQHFGHGRFYRIPYDKSIGNHLSTALKQQKDVVDLTESILGRSRDWAGRVSFSEAHLCNEPKWCECGKPHPLIGPKPTSFQFYLNQNSKTDKCKNWNNDDATIRGYKLYWHQPTKKANSWKNTSVKEGDKLSKYIQPIDSGMTFQSRIYFDNLSDIELGALLLTLNLDRLELDTAADEKKNISYKLGKGKSIGLGSIKLNSSLHILDRDKRYNTLFDNNAWQLGEIDISKDTFIDAFLKYRNNILGENQSSSDTMLSELLTMMDWNLANGQKPIEKWSEAVSMMSVDNDEHERFKKRVKLGTPSEFIKAWSKK